MSEFLSGQAAVDSLNKAQRRVLRAKFQGSKILDVVRTEIDRIYVKVQRSDNRRTQYSFFIGKRGRISDQQIQIINPSDPGY